MELLIVFLGGSIGALLRYGFYLLASTFGLPVAGTFFANILGCIIVGFLMHLETNNNYQLDKKLKLFFMTGIIGSFTTFSTYSYEILTMIQQGKIHYGLVYLLSSLVIGMSAILFGFWLESFIMPRKITVENNED